MKNKIRVALIILGVICYLNLSVFTREDIFVKHVYRYAKNADVLEIKSKSVCLMEPTTGKIIFEKNADEKLRPASVTKIMTLLLIFEAIEEGSLHYDDIVTVSEHAASMGGSQCFFECGEQQSVKDMIKCIEIASGNDAAVAMAEHIAGSEEAFVKMMNEKASKLGMNNTNFENACGLEAENHLTTARDIAIMSRELITKYPAIFEYSTIWMDRIYHKTSKGEKEFDLANTNKFLKQYNGAVGLKTGYTSQAKYCMSACAMRNDIMLIAVIMGADTKELRNSEAGKLLDFGFARCQKYVDEELQQMRLSTKITGGTKNKLTCYIKESSNGFVTEGNVENIERSIDFYDDICAPVRKDDIVGKILYRCNNEVIFEQYIYANEDIDKISYKHCILSLCGELFMMTRNAN